MAAQTFRDIFLTYNRPWLTGQLHEVFTPRTLFLYRKDIIDQFAKVMGEIQADVSLSDGEAEKKAPDAGSSDSSAAARREPEQKKAQKAKKLDHSRSSARSKALDPRTQDLNERVEAVPAIRKIIRYWLLRMRFVKTLRVQVQAIVDLHLAEECLYCGATTGITVELL